MLLTATAASKFCFCCILYWIQSLQSSLSITYCVDSESQKCLDPQQPREHLQAPAQTVTTILVQLLAGALMTSMPPR
jgi:hypothetical protein